MAATIPLAEQCHNALLKATTSISTKDMHCTDHCSGRMTTDKMLLPAEHTSSTSPLPFLAKAAEPGLELRAAAAFGAAAMLCRRPRHQLLHDRCSLSHSACSWCYVHGNLLNRAADQVLSFQTIVLVSHASYYEADSRLC